MRDRGKYRGQRKDNGEGVYGWYVEVKGRHFIISNDAKLLRRTISDFDTVFGDVITNLIEVIPETVGESTGIQDKNGVEIYAGNKAKKTYDGCFDGEVTGEIKFKPTKGYYLDCSHKKQFITKTTFDGNFSEEEMIVRKASLTCADVRIEVIDIHEEKL